MKTNLPCLALILSGTLLLSSCGGGSSTNSPGSGGNTPSVANAVTIDNTGVIPVLGNGSTSTVVYVHNNSNVTISGIKYTATQQNTQSNIAEKVTTASNAILDPAATGVCSSIPAFQSCPIALTTPVLGVARAHFQAKCTTRLNCIG